MSNNSELLAFGRVQFQSVFDLQQVWMDRPADHLPLQEAALDRFRDTIRQTNPLGICFVGSAGSGKTHLLGEIRREAAQHGANFVLSDLTDIRDFWPLLAMHYLQSLFKSMNGVPQLHRILMVLLTEASRPPDVAALLAFPRDELVAFANDLVPALKPIYGQEFVRRLRAFRALLYLDSEDFELSERAYSFLQGIEQIDDEAKKIYLSGPNSAKRVAVDLAWFLSLCGPTVLAFDQLDPFVAQNNLADLEMALPEKTTGALRVLMGVVNGIMAVRQDLARTIVVVACLESTWNVFEKRAIDSFCQRFQEVERLHAIRDSKKPLELVGKRLEQAYQLCDFNPPYLTWPFGAGFFKSLPPGLTPREILNRAEQHRLACVRAGEVWELNEYSQGKENSTKPPPPLAKLDEMFGREPTSVDPLRLLDPDNEDVLGDLLAKAAQIFRREVPVDPDIDIAAEGDFRESKKYQSLHLRMRRIFHAEGEREEHVCVRVLQKTHFSSFQVRLNAALTVSGMSEELEGRRLVLFRNSPPPSGKVTAEKVQHAKARGAEFLPIAAEDVRTIAAVVTLSKAGEPLFETWLLKNLPLSKTAVFQNLVSKWSTAPKTATALDPAVPAEPKPAHQSEPVLPKIVNPAPSKTKSTETESKPAEQKQLLFGNRLEAGSLGNPVYMPIVDLTRHVILRAGSGGGKTVFIKRLVEEAALCGISSIVIDTAKDLSMLGDRWKQAPAGWSDADVLRAEQYHRSVDVQIWTPGHSGGRPLRLMPLPNLSGPFEEAYDREQAIEIAVAGLLPLAVKKKGANVEKAILKKVVEWLTRQPAHSRSELERLIAALRDLPAEAFQGFQNERKLAATMADQIQATMVADTLYGADGEDLDPAVLFGVGSGRPRVSVLSLFAMADIETQARFIGQLGSVLFNWIRRNPAAAGSSARGLLVLDEAARFLPRHNAESKPALMLLAQQARKYGLGLVLATQNPMDLDYNATANFATQFFGTANVPQVVKFIQAAMEQRGMQGLNPGQLKAGQFFCATPSLEHPAKLQGRMCLSAHPHNTQLSDDEILEKARHSKGLSAALG